MWALRRDYEQDAAQLAGAVAATESLERSAAELEAVRGQQSVTAERIAALQVLLQARGSPGLPASPTATWAIAACAPLSRQAGISAACTRFRLHRCPR